MAETAWVLERAYDIAGRDIAAAIERMLQVNVFVVEREQEVFTAMTALKEGRGSFADALIAALGSSAGCSAHSHSTARPCAFPDSRWRSSSDETGPSPQAGGK